MAVGSLALAKLIAALASSGGGAVASQSRPQPFKGEVTPPAGSIFRPEMFGPLLEAFKGTNLQRPQLSPQPFQGTAQGGTLEQLLPAMLPDTRVMKANELQPDKSSRDRVKRRMSDIFERAAYKARSEEIGQDILDQMEAGGVSPRQVGEEFWMKTFPNLPENVQKKFIRQVKGASGFNLGDGIAVNADQSLQIAETYKDLNDAADLPDTTEYLEGADRGYVSLMAYANEKMKQAITQEPKMIK